MPINEIMKSILPSQIISPIHYCTIIWNVPAWWDNRSVEPKLQNIPEMFQLSSSRISKAEFSNWENRTCEHSISQASHPEETNLFIKGEKYGVQPPSKTWFHEMVHSAPCPALHSHHWKLVMVFQRCVIGSHSHLKVQRAARKCRENCGSHNTVTIRTPLGYEADCQCSDHHPATIFFLAQI